MAIESALITGTHRGLGEALALNLLAKGAKVFGISRHESENLKGKSNWSFRAADLTELDSIGGVMRELLWGVSKLDLVILNAGMLGEIKALREWTVPEIEKVMTLNVWANKVLIDTLFEMGIQVRQIVGISSGAAIKGSGGLAAYSLSKSAFITLLQVYASEHPETHFISLAPGQVRTAMTGSLHDHPGSDRFAATQRIKANYDAGKMTELPEAAERIVNSLPKLLECDSGSYQDVRDLGGA